MPKPLLRKLLAMGVLGPGGGEAEPISWYQADNDLANSLVGLWRLDETSGTRADSVGTNHLAEANGVASTTGLVYNTSALFDLANSERLHVASDAVLRTGDIDFWVAAWFKSSFMTGTRVIAANWTNAVRGWVLFNSGTTLTFTLGNGGNTSGTAITIASLSLNTDYFVVAWHDKTAQTVNLQLNNGSVASGARGVTPGTSTAEFEIGSNGGGTNFFSGVIGPVMLGKNYIPTSDDRALLWNGGDGLM